jgi:hypothetical protein
MNIYRKKKVKLLKTKTKMKFKQLSDQTTPKEFNENSTSSSDDLNRIERTSVPVNSTHVITHQESSNDRQDLISYLACYNILGRNHLMRRNAFGDIWNFTA